MQKLKLPFRRSVVSATCRSALYRQYWGFTHYGWDMGCDESGYAVLSMGRGTVLVSGYDYQVGHVLVIRYDDCVLKDGTVTDLICRMYHLKRRLVKKGAVVKEGQILADYGKSGAGKWGIHLHIEFDSDINYPTYAPSVRGGNLIKRGIATSIVDPAKVFYRKESQKIRGCKVKVNNAYQTWWKKSELNL